MAFLRLSFSNSAARSSISWCMAGAILTPAPPQPSTRREISTHNFANISMERDPGSKPADYRARAELAILPLHLVGSKCHLRKKIVAPRRRENVCLSEIRNMF